MSGGHLVQYSCSSRVT